MRGVARFRCNFIRNIELRQRAPSAALEAELPAAELVGDLVHERSGGDPRVLFEDMQRHLVKHHVGDPLDAQLHTVPGRRTAGGFAEGTAFCGGVTQCRQPAHELFCGGFYRQGAYRLGPILSSAAGSRCS